MLPKWSNDRSSHSVFSAEPGGSAGVFEFCMTFCWSTVDSSVRPRTTVYRAQTSYGLSRLCLACFGGVTVQREEVTSCNFRAPIATLGALGNPREVLTHPNCTQIFARPVNTSASRY